MAIVSFGAIERDIQALAKRSMRLKTMIRDAIRQLKHDPMAFRDLEDLPEELVATGAVFKTIDLVHQKHNYRICFFVPEPYADPLVVVGFAVIARRREGYRGIDWHEVRRLMDPDA